MQFKPNMLYDYVICIYFLSICEIYFLKNIIYSSVKAVNFLHISYSSLFCSDLKRKMMAYEAFLGIILNFW